MTDDELARLLRRCRELREECATLTRQLVTRVDTFRETQNQTAHLMTELRALNARLRQRPAVHRDIPFADWSMHMAQVHGVKLTSTTLRVLRSQGKGPHAHLVGGKLYSTPQALATWLAGRRRPTKSKHNR